MARLQAAAASLRGGSGGGGSGGGGGGGGSSGGATAALLSLQHREITPNDYTALLSLDGGSFGLQRPSSSQAITTTSTNTKTLPVYLLEVLMTFGGSRCVFFLRFLLGGPFCLEHFV